MRDGFVFRICEYEVACYVASHKFAQILQYTPPTKECSHGLGFFDP
jgi:hypothetical protein